MDQPLKKLITIESWENKTTSTGKELFTIKDTEGNRYTVWKMKSDGETITKAADWLMQNEKSRSVAYNESVRAYDFEKEGKRMQGTTVDRNVAWFEESISQPSQPVQSMEAGAIKAMNVKMNDLIDRVAKLESIVLQGIVSDIKPVTQQPEASDVPLSAYAGDEVRMEDIPF